MSRAKRELDNAIDAYEQAERRSQTLKNDLLKKEQIYKDKVRFNEEAKKKAAKAYLAEYQRSLCGQIKTYLLGSDVSGRSIISQLKHNMSEMLDQTKPKFEEIAIHYFENALQRKLEELGQTIQHNAPYMQSQLALLQDADLQLEQISKRMEAMNNDESI